MIKIDEYTTGPEAIPPRPRFGWRISRGKTPMDLKWRVEYWRGDEGYYNIQSNSLFDALHMLFVALDNKKD